jgi:MOSC domain-containing protein YiiM
MKGEILAVCVSRAVGEKKTNVGRAMLIADHGLEGDAHAGSGHRQVSLLSLESIDKMRSRGFEPQYGDFAENLTVAGIELRSLPVGTLLRVGDAVELQVTQIGKECHAGCAIRQLVGDCVMPREGVFARVVSGGTVSAGDSIEIKSRPLSCRWG